MTVITQLLLNGQLSFIQNILASLASLSCNSSQSTTERSAIFAFGVLLGYLHPSNVHSGHKLNSLFSLLPGCSTTLNETFGQIEFTTTSYYDVRCNWKIHSAGISDAVAFISVQELNLYYCR